MASEPAFERSSSRLIQLNKQYCLPFIGGETLASIKDGVEYL
jgi:hypothetical protein